MIAPPGADGFYDDGAVAARAGRVSPFGTVVVNLSGAVALGLAVGLAFTGSIEHLQQLHLGGGLPLARHSF